MKARGGRFLLVLGAGLAVMSFVVVYLLMSRGSLVGASQSASVPTPSPVKSVAVVNRDLAAYTVLDASNVSTQEIDASSVISGSTQDPSAVFGKMITTPMSKGQQVSTTQLAQSGFSNVLLKGEKAFALAVPARNTFGGALTENDRIDFIWTDGIEQQYQLWPDGTIKDKPFVFSTTKTLLQDIKVLRVIQLQPTTTKPAAQNTDAAAAEQASTVNTRANVQTAAMYAAGADPSTVLILAVTDQQAELLKYAREHNDLLDFTLRSSAPMKDADGKPLLGDDKKPVMGDHENEKTTGITLDTLIQQYGLVPIPQSMKK